MEIKYNQKFDLYLACEPRTVPYEWHLAEDGLFPGVRPAYGQNPERFMPASYVEKGRLPVTHVLAVASTRQEAERLGNIARNRK